MSNIAVPKVWIAHPKMLYLFLLPLLEFLEEEVLEII